MRKVLNDCYTAHEHYWNLPTFHPFVLEFVNMRLSWTSAVAVCILTIEKCHFVNAGQGPINAGGGTGAMYFRPPGANYQARNIVIRGCTFEGGMCATAFAGLDSGEFSGNTILFPQKWLLRILGDPSNSSLIACRNVVVKDNRFVFRRSDVQTDINIGSATYPETFRFEKNKWFAVDQPARSKPALPVPETEGQYGIDPR